MVQTRRQYTDWVSNRGSNYQSSQSCSECSSQSNNSQQSFDFNMENAPQHARYASSDHCHRHRGPDDGAYDTLVTSYRRRKPV